MLNHSFFSSENSAFRLKFLATSIGNALEFFDFSVFGSFADVIGHLYFPTNSEYSDELELLKALAVYGAALLLRPLGGIIMGRIGDLYGRKRALEVSIALMLVPSFLIGLCPTFHQVGWIGSFVLVICRLAQGFAVGGELVGAFCFIIEEKEGTNSQQFWGAMVKLSGGIGTCFGLGCCYFLRAYLTNEHLYAWGWRLPFLLSLVFGIVGLWLRSKLKKEEYSESTTKEHEQQQQQQGLESGNDDGKEGEEGKDMSGERLLEPAQYPPSQSTMNHIHSHTLTLSPTHSDDKHGNTEVKSFKPAIEAINTYWREILALLLVVSFWAVGYYSLFVWLQYFLSSDQMMGGEGRELHVTTAWKINFISNVSLFAAFPFAGYLGDVVGKYYQSPSIGCTRVMQAGLIIMIVFVIPAFYSISTGTMVGIFIAEFIFCVSLSLFGANLPAFMCRQFKPRLRYSSMGISYNLSNAIFAGSAPTVQTFLALQRSHHDSESSSSPSSLLHVVRDSRMGPAYYIIAISTMSLVSLTILVPWCKSLRKDDALRSHADVEEETKKEIKERVMKREEEKGGRDEEEDLQRLTSRE